MARAVFGGGCFWCLEAVFSKLAGVTQVVSGYAGGSTPDPSYESVCGGATGHAEVVAIDYAPDQITYLQLLEVFFVIHDPTTLNRQGADTGTQYRSIILVEDDEQRQTAECLIGELGGHYASPIVTVLENLSVFYPAEEYHQRYFERNSSQAYCAFVVAPKLLRAQEKFSALLKPAYR